MYNFMQQEQEYPNPKRQRKKQTVRHPPTHPRTVKGVCASCSPSLDWSRVCSRIASFRSSVCTKLLGSTGPPIMPPCPCPCPPPYTYMCLGHAKRALAPLCTWTCLGSIAYMETCPHTHTCFLSAEGVVAGVVVEATRGAVRLKPWWPHRDALATDGGCPAGGRKAWALRGCLFVCLFVCVSVVGRVSPSSIDACVMSRLTDQSTRTRPNQTNQSDPDQSPHHPTTHLPATNAAPRRRAAVRALRGLMPLLLSMLSLLLLLMLKLTAAAVTRQQAAVGFARSIGVEECALWMCGRVSMGGLS